MITYKDLEYPYDRFSEVIDPKTMEVHYTKHYQTYCNNYNNAIKGTQWEDMCVGQVLSQLEQLPEEIRTVVRNNGGGAVNHDYYFHQFNENSSLEDSPLKEQIIKDFGSVENFLDQFKQACLTLFGSGWVWLVFNNGKLEIRKYPNQDNPRMDGLKPILGIDVWEHAYYLKYQNVRPEYVENIMTIIDWDVINNRFMDAQK